MTLALLKSINNAALRWVENKKCFVIDTNYYNKSWKELLIKMYISWFNKFVTVVDIYDENNDSK